MQPHYSLWLLLPAICLRGPLLWTSLEREKTSLPLETAWWLGMELPAETILFPCSLEEWAQPIINAGRNGDTTKTGLSRLATDALSQDPKIVMLLLGGNDALRKVPRQETFTRLAAMIDDIHKTGAAVILIGVPWGNFRRWIRRGVRATGE